MAPNFLSTPILAQLISHDIPVHSQLLIQKFWSLGLERKSFEIKWLMKWGPQHHDSQREIILLPWHIKVGLSTQTLQWLGAANRQPVFYWQYLIVQQASKVTHSVTHCAFLIKFFSTSSPVCFYSLTELFSCLLSSSELFSFQLFSASPFYAACLMEKHGSSNCDILWIWYDVPVRLFWFNHVSIISDCAIFLHCLGLFPPHFQQLGPPHTAMAAGHCILDKQSG